MHNEFVRFLAVAILVLDCCTMPSLQAWDGVQSHIPLLLIRTLQKVRAENRLSPERFAL